MKAYEVFNALDGNFPPSFFPNRRDAEAMNRDTIMEKNTGGDFEIAEVDACKRLEELAARVIRLEQAINLAAWRIVGLLPCTKGKVDPAKYHIEEREAHAWVVEHAPDVAELHELK